MSLELRLSALVIAIGADIKKLIANNGDLSLLSTTEKTSIAAAINEIYLLINTTVPTPVNNALLALRNEILGGASSVYNVLQELQILLANNPNVDAILTSIGNRVRYDAPQQLTLNQQTQACVNIGVGNPEHDFLSDYLTARGQL
ncbi:conserved hypothetical protein [Gammaproteobacteria bacterium]